MGNGSNDMARWLSARSVAAKFDVKARQINERYSRLPGFPQPRRAGGNGRPRWSEAEIDCWMDAQPTDAPQSARRSRGSKSTANEDHDDPRSGQA